MEENKKSMGQESFVNEIYSYHIQSAQVDQKKKLKEESNGMHSALSGLSSQMPGMMISQRPPMIPHMVMPTIGSSNPSTTIPPPKMIRSFHPIGFPQNNHAFLPTPIEEEALNKNQSFHVSFPSQENSFK